MSCLLLGITILFSWLGPKFLTDVRTSYELDDNSVSFCHPFKIMSNFLFIILLKFLSCLQMFIVFIFRVFFHPRKEFENKNFHSIGCQSFAEVNIVADFCFEVSSEGELEQVRPLIHFYLERKKLIELIFSSPSVESKCMELQNSFSTQVRILRLPLLTSLSLKKWITAPIIIFCRYDFFPDLLLLKSMGKKFVLLSGAVKKRSWYKTQVFKMFDIIVAATSHEEKQFFKLNKTAKLFTYDFRIKRITERWENAPALFKQKTQLNSYLEFLNNVPMNQRIIIGSAWESDLSIFNNPHFISAIKESRVHILIVPHQLGPESFKKIFNYFEKMGLDQFVNYVDENTPTKPILILNMSGVLCELYSLFAHSYVGGGYERSIHSVFEPFFSGSRVYTGPQIGRSTEYDLVAEIASNEIHVLFQAEQFYNIYMNNKELVLDQHIRELWRNEASLKIEKIANKIGSLNAK